MTIDPEILKNLKPGDEAYWFNDDGTMTTYYVPDPELEEMEREYLRSIGREDLIREAEET